MIAPLKAILMESKCVLGFCRKSFPGGGGGGKREMPKAKALPDFFGRSAGIDLMRKG